MGRACSTIRKSCPLPSPDFCKAADGWPPSSAGLPPSLPGHPQLLCRRCRPRLGFFVFPSSCGASASHHPGPRSALVQPVAPRDMNRTSYGFLGRPTTDPQRHAQSRSKSGSDGEPNAPGPVTAGDPSALWPPLRWSRAPTTHPPSCLSRGGATELCGAIVHGWMHDRLKFPRDGGSPLLQRGF